MFSGRRLSTSRPSCHAVGVSARRLGLPLGWTVVIFWFSGADWSADVKHDYALLLHQLFPWVGPALLDLAHWLARKAGQPVTPKAVRDRLASDTYHGVVTTYRSDGKGNMAHEAEIVCFDGTDRIPKPAARYAIPPRS